MILWQLLYFIFIKRNKVPEEPDPHNNPRESFSDTN